MYMCMYMHMYMYMSHAHAHVHVHVGPAERGAHARTMESMVPYHVICSVRENHHRPPTRHAHHPTPLQPYPPPADAVALRAQPRTPNRGARPRRAACGWRAAVARPPSSSQPHGSLSRGVCSRSASYKGSPFATMPNASSDYYLHTPRNMPFAGSAFPSLTGPGHGKGSAKSEPHARVARGGIHQRVCRYV